MRFIITAQAGTGEAKAGTEPTFDENLFISYMKFNEEMHKAGILIASEGLNPGARSARVAVSQGKRHVVDGPFAESKELVGGFYIIDVESLDEAIGWALGAPEFLDALQKKTPRRLRKSVPGRPSKPAISE